MLQGRSPVSQALLGTFFTWGMTAAGAALVFIFSSGQRRILDGSLGFAAGVMLAASYWSLLAPAVEMATSSGGFGALAFFPVAVGFTLGAAFVYVADLLMPHLGAAEDPQTALALNLEPALLKKADPERPGLLFPESELSIRIGRAGLLSDKSENGEAYQRKKAVAADLPESPAAPVPSQGNLVQPGGSSWRRIALLILAITIHNIPEGLAVGVGFGAVEKTASATFEVSDLKTQAKSKDEETATIITQLKLERDVHQRELEDLTSSLQSVKSKHEQNIQELMKHFKKEKSEAESHIRTLKAESLEDKNMAKVQRCQLEKLKSQYDRLTEELTQNENENKKLKLKYQCLKDQLEEKEKHISNEEEHLRRMEEARLQLKDQLLCLETEQESILGVIGKEIDAACKTFSRDSMEKLKVFSSGPDINYDPHRWLAESKTKLQWLCEELKERENREKSLQHQLMLCRQQLRNMTENKESELQCLFEQIERQEQLLEEIHREKRDLLEETHRKDEEMESLQDRVNALEMSTRVALDHLESVPEKLSLLEDFKGFRDSRSLSERSDGRYSRYRFSRESLQQRQDDTTYRVPNFKDDRDFVERSHAHGLDQSSSWQDHSHFLSSPRFSHLNYNSGVWRKGQEENRKRENGLDWDDGNADGVKQKDCSELGAFTQRTVAPDSPLIMEDATDLLMDGTSPQSKKEESESKKSKM